CDTAHNSHGLKIVLKQIERQSHKALHVVFGVVNDKDLSDVLPLMPKNAVYYFCKPNIPRGLDANMLQAEAGKYNLDGAIYDSVAEAYNAALHNAAEDDFIFVGGSTFVVAEIL